MTEDGLGKRQRTVTEEPFAISGAIKGRELATVRRRGAAIFLDAVVWGLVAIPIVMASLYIAMYLQTPTLARYMTALISGQPPSDRDGSVTELLALVERRRPGALPSRLSEHLASGDMDAFAQQLERETSTILTMFRTEPSHFDTRTNVLHINGDVIFGPFRSVFSFAAVALVYFSLVTWITGGRSPGKWLFGIRTVKLDGDALTLGDAFSRAGGYTASVSTLGLGFLGALRDPNRQALHARVARTMVIRETRREGPLRRLWRRFRSKRAD